MFWKAKLSCGIQSRQWDSTVFNNGRQLKGSQIESEQPFLSLQCTSPCPILSAGTELISYNNLCQTISSSWNLPTAKEVIMLKLPSVFWHINSQSNNIQSCNHQPGWFWAMFTARLWLFPPSWSPTASTNLIQVGLPNFFICIENVRYTDWGPIKFFSAHCNYWGTLHTATINVILLTTLSNAQSYPHPQCTR